MLERAARLGRAAIHDARFHRGAYQVIAVSALLMLGILVFRHVARTLSEQNIATGFTFLNRQAGFVISQTFLDYHPTDTYGRALLAGAVNTIVISVLGIVLATLLGVAVGISQLSAHRLLALIARLYVNVQRGVPLLLWLFFWYAVIVMNLPPGRGAWQIVPGVFLTNAGLSIPSLRWTSAHVILLLSVMCALFLALLVSRLSRRQFVGARWQRLVVPWIFVFLLGMPLIAITVLRPEFAVDFPEQGRFRVTGGARVSAEFTALLIALSLSASAAIAEITRAGIQAVPTGQWEAAISLGLGRLRALRLVILPQALRVIIPPLTGSYVSLLKSSSLAIAVGYPDLLMVANTTITQTGQAIEGTTIYMLVFLALSLAAAAFMNWYNERNARWGLPR